MRVGRAGFMFERKHLHIGAVVILPLEHLPESVKKLLVCQLVILVEI